VLLQAQTPQEAVLEVHREAHLTQIQIVHQVIVLQIQAVHQMKNLQQSQQPHQAVSSRLIKIISN
jgi:hypothetical protein